MTQFGKEKVRTEFDDGRVEIAEEVIRNGKVVNVARWREESEKVTSKNQLAAFFISSAAQLESGEITELELQVKTNPETGQPDRVVRKVRVRS